jgi:hypothetical protein
MLIPVGSGLFIHPNWLGRSSDQGEIPPQSVSHRCDLIRSDTSIQADLVRSEQWRAGGGSDG